MNKILVVVENVYEPMSGVFLSTNLLQAFDSYADAETFRDMCRNGDKENREYYDIEYIITEVPFDSRTIRAIDKIFK